jgi:glycosyltransferase involved in cell wall biosynthesis
MKLLLLGNYPPDAQQSMLRFGAMIHQGATARGWDTAAIAPATGRLTRALRRVVNGGARKWLGYLDKYVLFRPVLARRLQSETHAARRSGIPLVVHVMDHSNALYIPRKRIRGVTWAVTCHDLLAVRGALGEDTDCPATPLGRRLQRSIVRGLGRAAAIAADSTSTLQDVDRLVAVEGQLRRVILLGLNHSYSTIGYAEARARVATLAGIPWSRPFLLHVGSNLPRKNKAGVLRVFARLRVDWPGNLVFCGAELPEELRAAALAAGVSERVFAVASPDNVQLEAIYNLAHALLFPSRCEGFGWPVIEAQACGCPVVCSDRTSLSEVGGAAAIVHALEDEAGMAHSILRLADEAWRTDVVRRGQANVLRFAPERMIDAYAALYEEVLAGATLS